MKLQQGSLLIEVLFALFVFAFGMLALITLNTKTIQNNTEMTIRDKTFNVSREFINSLTFNPLTPFCCSVQVYSCPNATIPIHFKSEFEMLCTSNKTAKVIFNLSNAPVYSTSCGSFCSSIKTQGTVTVQWVFKGEQQSYTAYISNMELQ